MPVVRFGPANPDARFERASSCLLAVRTLVEQGRAYPCYCTEAELAALREHQLARGDSPRYDGRCLSLYAEHRHDYETAGRKPAIRLRLPEGGAVVVRDRKRGEVTFAVAGMGDFVIQDREDEPSRPFAWAVRAAARSLPCLLRTDEDPEDTARRLLALDALGVAPPVFAQLPAWMLRGRRSQK